jgi:hypothetical protein
MLVVLVFSFVAGFIVGEIATTIFYKNGGKK